MSIARSELGSFAPEPRDVLARTRATALVSEEVFEHLLVRERKRSERSNRPFILLLLSASGSLDPASSRAGKAIIEALLAGTRATDIVGWAESPAMVGVIFPEIGAAQPAQAVDALRTRLYRELAQRVDAKMLAELSLQFRTFPEGKGSDGGSGTPAIDPVFHPDVKHEERTRRVYGWMKRLLDVIISFALLVGLSPWLLLIALAVRWTSPGPILFKQVRLGRMGKPFKILKFRSMHVNVSEKLHHDYVTRFIKESGGQQASNGDQIFKLTDDPRVTPIGRILRKTSLDELPQLWNVLVGDISLVGPRPPMPYELEQYAPWHRRRILEAKPGVTGLWQVTGRSRTTFDEMVRLDLRYARMRSLWVDLKILLRTPGAVFGGKGAA
jgi:lipopolysaccharide/colanic/teichoic acid biosynthesis glycosyltransferase